MVNCDESGKVLCADISDIQEIFIGWTKSDLTHVTSALFDSGWLDKSNEDIYIHDWKKWQEQWFKTKKKKENDLDRYYDNKGKNLPKNILEPDEIDETQDKAEEVPIDERPAKPSSVPKDTKYTKKFERLWEKYPYKRGNKESAFRAYKARITEGYTYEQLYDATLAYADFVAREGQTEKFVKHASTFFGPDKHFKDYLYNGGEPEEFDENENPFAKYMRKEE